MRRPYAHCRSPSPSPRAKADRGQGGSARGLVRPARIEIAAMRGNGAQGRRSARRGIAPRLRRGRSFFRGRRSRATKRRRGPVNPPPLLDPHLHFTRRAYTPPGSAHARQAESSLPAWIGISTCYERRTGNLDPHMRVRRRAHSPPGSAGSLRPEETNSSWIDVSASMNQPVSPFVSGSRRARRVEGRVDSKKAATRLG